jgi:chemotaxis protein methyltransferase CheR
MRDDDGVRFLQWCLPRLRLRWPGFRKVRKQVYKRIDRRLKELRLADVTEYRAYLERHDQEWSALDGLCRIPISRFYRDRALFEFLERDGLPELAREASARGEYRIRCWSAGCASGEEPYTLAILWRVRLAPRLPAVSLEILATDVDPVGLERAKSGCYSPSSLKDLPRALLDRAFTRSEAGLCVKAEYREGIEWLEKDLRVTMPVGPFQLILCRNVVFTYFDDALQQEVLKRIVARLGPEGVLVIGAGEALPPGIAGIEPWSRQLGVYRRFGQPSGAGAAHP